MGDRLVAIARHERIGRAVEPEHHADRSAEGLRPHVDAGLLVGLGHPVDHLGEPIGRAVDLGDGEGEFHARLAGYLMEIVEVALCLFVIIAVGQRRGDLEHAAPAGDLPGERDQFGLLDPVARDMLAVAAAVEIDIRCSKADRAGLHGLAQYGHHLFDILRGGLLAPRGALAHHENAERRVGDVDRHVDVVLPLLERFEELGEAFPFPGQSFDHHHAGDVLDAFHCDDEHVAVGRTAGCEADPAIAGNHGGDAMCGGGGQPVRPDRLAVIMGVHVDEAGGNEHPLRIDLLGRRSLDLADGGNEAVPDRDVADERLGTRSIDDASAADDKVMRACHGTFSLLDPCAA